MTNAHDEPHEQRVPDDAGIEALLRQVGAREEPSAAMMAEVEAAVHAEWQTMAARRQRRRTVGWGMAASFVVVVAAATFGLRYLNGPSPVATIADIDGHVLVASGGGLLSSERWSERASGQQVMK